MMIIVAAKALLDHRLHSVTGRFSLSLRIQCFFAQTGDKTRRYLQQPNARAVFITRVTTDSLNPHRVVTPLIPIGQSPQLTASRRPAVSSLEAYQTPAR
jgi:hypothetical protein